MQKAVKIGTSARLYGPALTFQAGPEGRLVNGDSVVLPFSEDAPARFRRRFDKSWAKSRYSDRAWPRLLELVASKLEELPDNPFVLEEAWLCGLHLDGGPRVAGARRLYLDDIAAADSARAEAETLAYELASIWDATEVVSAEVYPSELSADVQVRDLASDKVTGWRLRNIHDVGLVINPLFPVAPRREPGGVVRAHQGALWFWDLEPEGERTVEWRPVRPLTEAESVCYLRVAKFPVISDRVRMD